ncbi:hypothetical protein MXM51_08665 [Pantoea stewartii]|uniref:hypothetical protein n=1 Tax=Pantoea stewartii TaxID=66269 RepID=UPI002DBFA661|nr:hypothetical protein [Pantoea stewartii]MEB6534617.1 hypothetical protein [Pantoea stewartii]
MLEPYINSQFCYAHIRVGFFMPATYTSCLLLIKSYSLVSKNPIHSMLAGSAHADNWIFPCNDFCLCNAGFFNERIEPLKIRSLLNLPLFLAFILALNVLVKGNPFRFDRETAMMRDRTARSKRRKYQIMPSVTVMSVKTGIESIVKTVTGFATVTHIQDERFW